MIYDLFYRAFQQQQKCLALLIDPDKADRHYLEQIKTRVTQSNIDFIFIGGSLLKEDRMDSCLKFLKSNFTTPVVLFPGDIYQLNSRADGILLLSLISGRNAELLIGKHVTATPQLRRSGLEIIPTGYLLIDGGHPTTVSYMSQTLPIPRNKPDIAACTASAGELLGLRVAFLDAGSGAREPVPAGMVRQVRDEITIPLIVGGGIKTAEHARCACEAGADIIVIGNIVEQDPDQLIEISEAVSIFNKVKQFS